MNAFVSPFTNAIKPIIPGRDFAGTVVGLPSSNDSTYVIGDEVYGTSGNLISVRVDGAHAEYCLLPVEAVTLKPKNLSFVQAGTIGTPYSVALQALKRADAKKGGTVLILGASGAVGTAVFEIAKGPLECTVITASRRDTTDINTVKDPKFDGVRQKTEGRGVDIIIDCAGTAEGMEAALGVLARWGRYAFVAAGKGGDVKLNAVNLYRANQTIIGVNSLEVDVKDVAGWMSELREWFENGTLKVPTEEGVTKISIEEAVDKYQEVSKLGGKKYVIVFE